MSIDGQISDQIDQVERWRDVLQMPLEKSFVFYSEGKPVFNKIYCNFAK